MIAAMDQRIATHKDTHIYTLIACLLSHVGIGVMDSALAHCAAGTVPVPTNENLNLITRQCVIVL